MNLYFIRHGDPDYETDSLTEKGRNQAAKLRDAIKGWKIDELYQSPLGRAKETASCIASNWATKPVTLDWLSELVWGKKDGNPYDCASPWMIIDKQIETEHGYSQGDSWKELEIMKNDRIVSDLEEHCKKFDSFLEEHGFVRKNQLYYADKPDDKNIAFICHGGISSALIGHLLNIPFFQFNAHISLDCTSISKVCLSGEKGKYVTAKLCFINDVKHLEPQ